VNVRLATQEELPAIAALLDEATAYGATKGFDQWPVPFPQDELAHRVEHGELYAVDLDGELAATFTLVADDPFFWGERPPDALYIHKLAVRRSLAGRGIGAALLAWAEARVREAGRDFLRLDCIRDNPGIRTYYEALGFDFRGEHDDPRFAVALYEKRVA
jgi:GNAT superfamily N-acetyltransferase